MSLQQSYAPLRTFSFVKGYLYTVYDFPNKIIHFLPGVSFTCQPPWGLFSILLTILTEVIHNNNSTQQLRWCPIDDAVYGAQEDGQSLLVEADYNSGSWKLAWILIMFGFTTRSQAKVLTKDIFMWLFSWIY